METLTSSPFEMSIFYFLRSTFTNAAHALLFPVCVPDSSIVFRCNRRFFLQRSLWPNRDFCSLDIPRLIFRRRLLQFEFRLCSRISGRSRFLCSARHTLCCCKCALIEPLQPECCFDFYKFYFVCSLNLMMPFVNPF